MKTIQMTHALRPHRAARSSGVDTDRRRVVWALAASGLGLSACGGGGGDGGGTPGGGPDVPPAPGVAGPAWWGFGRDAQHTAASTIASQPFARIAWSTPVDLKPQYQNGDLLVHYASPVISSHNSVIVPMKTGATGGFRVEARSGVNGGLIWSAEVDYRLPAHRWMPGFNLALSHDDVLWVPGAGGKVFRRERVDEAGGAVQTRVFYGQAQYDAAAAALDASVFINTPITVDSVGNVFFGFVADPGNPAGLFSGLARLGADGSARWVAAVDLSGQAGIAKPAMNAAPALSPDEGTLYLALNSAAGGGTQHGMLVAIDSSTLAPRAGVVLRDPQTGDLAFVSDDGTSSPTIGPDGDVFFGVLESELGRHNARGWLLHFDASLATVKIPGSFGWDDTASVIPATMVTSYAGSSDYLLVTKYNNYLGAGSGDGLNRMAVLDPQATQVDPLSGRPVMREVLTILGVTPESPGSAAVKEWCVNTVAVDPLTRSVLVNSEDGVLYRWDLGSNRLTQSITLTGGLGEAYTPTAIGADGTVYAINRSVLFAVAG